MVPYTLVGKADIEGGVKQSINQSFNFVTLLFYFKSLHVQ